MGTITIGNKEFEFNDMVLRQNELLFYEDNPRIFSIINTGDELPSQAKIEETLKNMDHVKQLRVSIEQNGGLIDPIIVIDRDNEYIVLEGNSRLAAYRILASKDPIKWCNIKCSVLTANVSDDAIFTLLGQYHLVGRKDWSKFEQAAYLSRKKDSSNLDDEVLAKSVGLTKGTVKQYLTIYEFMKEHDDLRPDKWSYYEEYMKHQGIKKYREALGEEMDEFFSKQVKSGKIKQAIDVRNVFGVVAKEKGKVANKLVKEVLEEKITIYDAFDRYESTGKTGGAYVRIKRFRETLTDEDFAKKVVLEASANKDVRYEIKKINEQTGKLLKKLEIRN